MSEAGDKPSEQDQELRRRNIGGFGDEKLNSDDNSDNKHSENSSLKLDSPADSDNEQRFGSENADSDHVRKNFIDFSKLLENSVAKLD